MKTGKDEGKLADPLFPKMHIRDADKEKATVPSSRNKMAICERYNNAPRSMTTPPSNGCRSITQMLGPIHYRNPCASGNSLMTAECNLFLPHGFSSYNNRCTKKPRDENNSTSQSKILKYGSSHTDKDELTNFSSISSDKLHSAYLKLPNTRKRCALAMDDSSHFSQRLQKDNGRTMIDDSIKEFSKDTVCGAMQNGNKKKQENSSVSAEDSIPGLDFTYSDVVRVIGERFFWEARKTILHQQKQFSTQVFELHRLIKVQKIISENNSHLYKSSIKFPPMNNKLLYVTPLDPSPLVSKPKLEPTNSKVDIIGKKSSLSTKNAAQETTDVKLPPPLRIHPPLGNQWLIPIKSPSEGLIYKPYPCPTNSGFLAPVFENCGTKRFSGTAIGQNWFKSLNLDATEMKPFSRAKKQPSLSTQRSTMLSDSGDAANGSDSDATNLTLSLFPTEPILEASKDKYNEQRINVIKVVPHNRKSAPECAARIFQSILEERQKNE